MADAVLSASTAAHSSSERYQVVIHVEPEAHPALEDGPSLAEKTVDRISCDSSVVRIVERDGNSLSIARRAHLRAHVPMAPPRRACAAPAGPAVELGDWRSARRATAPRRNLVLELRLALLQRSAHRGRNDARLSAAWTCSHR
jgi:hypothetical protein